MVLRAERLVVGEPEGRRVWHSISPEEANHLAALDRARMVADPS